MEKRCVGLRGSLESGLEKFSPLDHYFYNGRALLERVQTSRDEAGEYSVFGIPRHSRSGKDPEVVIKDDEVEGKFVEGYSPRPDNAFITHIPANDDELVKGAPLGQGKI